MKNRTIALSILLLVTLCLSIYSLADQGNDVIEGDSQNNEISSGGGDDNIHGEAGDDIINSGSGDDLVSGGPGDDKIRGGEGNDYIIGGDGNDTVDAGAGNDYVDLGSGNDIYVYNIKENSGSNDFVDGGSGEDTLVIVSDDEYDELANEIVKHYKGQGVITKDMTTVAGLDIGLGVSNFESVVMSAGFTF